ncbi:S1 family peptidase [Gemmata sp.]|uniref:S1 family peptidase n=1 Tax=Gemmata sp. TaxID=1914242 RepID=UPI003F7156E0
MFALTAVLLAVQLTDVQWAALLASPRVSSPGSADGTGVVVGTKDGFGYVLTAAHVTQGDLVELKFTSRASYPKVAWFGDGAEVVARWPDPDVALVRFPLRGHAPSVVTLAPALDRPKRFPVGALGIGIGGGPAATSVPNAIVGREYVKREGKGGAFFWRTEVPPEAGRSGGPLLDAAGRVIGIAVATRGGAGYYAHHDEIVAALRRDGYGWLVTPRKP